MGKWKEKPNEEQMNKKKRKVLRKKQLVGKEQEWLNDKKDKKDGNWMN